MQRKLVSKYINPLQGIKKEIIRFTKRAEYIPDNTTLKLAFLLQSVIQHFSETDLLRVLTENFCDLSILHGSMLFSAFSTVGYWLKMKMQFCSADLSWSYASEG